DDMTRYLEMVRLPPAERAAARLQLAAMRRPAGIGSSRFGRIEAALLPGLAQLRCATVALAAERFRLRHGRLPDQLRDLVPEFLAGVPADPFNEQAPLSWDRVNGTASVYSVGQPSTGRS